MNVAYYTTASGRQPAADFIGEMPVKFRAQVRMDIDAVAELGSKAAASTKPVTGYLPMWEIRTGNYRVFYFFMSATLVVLHACKKEDAHQGIALAYKRMEQLGG